MTNQPEAYEPLRIYALEVHAVQHCNLRCVGCAQSSPTLTRGYESPDTLERTLSNLAPHIYCEKLQVLGGEPLLHPQIADILSVSSQSGLAPKLTVKTNGLLLHRATTRFWRLADEVIVSVYPATESALARRRVELEQVAFEHGTKLLFRKFSDFQEIASTARLEDDVLTQEIYASCKFKNFTHSVRDGRIYRCAPSVNQVRGRADLEGHDSLNALDHINMRERLIHFLTSPQPLRACGECMGSGGATFPHTMEINRQARSRLS